MISAITGLIGGLLYPLFSIIFVLIDLLQGVFYGLAGIGDIGFNSKSSSYGQDFWGNNQTIGSTNDGGETSTGLIYYLLTSPLIKNLFMSIMLLALFLIIIFTAMAFIKNAYSSKQKNWQEIVGNAFKGLANFIFIPVCCLLGVWLSNILLLAINGATSTGGAVNMSRKLFVCCAYDANEYRNKTEITGKQIAATSETINGKTISVTYDGDLGDIQKLVLVCDDVKVDFDPAHRKDDVEYFANVVDTVYAQTSKDYANIHWWGSVERHYSLFNFNYLVLIVGGVFMLYVLVSVAYAMVKRMFILLMLFVVSPAICAMYPLDEGSAVGNWKKEFIKYTISAYGAIAAMNLFFSILPIVENINLIYGEGAGFAIAGGLFNDIFQLLIMVSGLFVVKEFMGTLSGWIGGDNALSTGESLRKSTKGAMDKYAKPAVKRTVGAFANMSGHIKSEGFWKGMRSSFADTMLGQKDDKGNRKHDGLLNFMSGGAEKEVSEFLNSTKDSYKYGKGAKSKDELRDIQKQYEDDTKDMKKNFKIDDAWKRAGGYKDENTGKYVTVDRNERIRRMNKDLEEHGFADEAERLNIINSKLGNNAAGKMRSLTEVKELLTKGTKAHDKEERKKENEETYGLMGSKIAEEISRQMQGTPTGGRSHVEDTMMERQEIQLLREIRDLLSGNGKGSGGVGITEDALLKLAKANQMSAAADGAINKAMKEVLDNHLGGTHFANRLKAKMEGGKEITVESMGLHTKVNKASFEANETQINSYNAALQAKENAEKMAKEATAALIKEFENAAKGNKVAEKAVEEFAKSMKTSVKDIEEFAKKLNEILKK